VRQLIPDGGRYPHLQGFGETVSVAGMVVRPGDLIHADCHGAIVIPVEVADKLPAAAELLARREEVILTIARSKDFSIEKLKAAMAKSAEIH
jgi:regulator of RNase E activity RraA